MHSLGYKYGYSLPDPRFVNPVNKVMLYAQEVIICSSTERFMHDFSLTRELYVFKIVRYTGN